LMLSGSFTISIFLRNTQTKHLDVNVPGVAWYRPK
jgi:hypothetical protein